MFILAIESSEQTGSVAVLEDNRVLGALTSGVERTHSEKLLPLVDLALSQSGVAKADLNLIAVSVGPGSFTGLRIGVGLAKGLATGLEIPVVPVQTLLALAHNACGSDLPICAMTVSRKSEIYTGTFRWHRGEIQRLTPDCVLTPEDLIGAVTERTLFLGNGAVVWRNFLQETLGDLCLMLPEPLNLPRAEVVGCLGYQAFQLGENCDLSSLAPVYVREPIPIVRHREKAKEDPSP